LTQTLLLKNNFHFYLTLLIWILQACSDNPNNTSKTETKYSNTQTYLFQLLEEYNSEYFAATETADREKLQSKYQDKMEHFLVDSLGRYIDSMTVVVDTVIKQGWLVTTQFHARDIEFKYSLNFQENMPPSYDSLYKFMLGLSPGKEVTVDFFHLGGWSLNLPDDKSQRTMRIFALPSPLKH
jgi:hypothetical protein